jgi:transcriptional regulator with XRE-family HTH domain
MKGRALIAWNIRRLRTARGLTQMQLGGEADVDHVYLGMVEREKGNATIDILDKLAKALGVHVSELLREPDVGTKKPRGLQSGRKPAAQT